MSDLSDLADLCARFAAATDDADPEAYADCFLADGVYDVRPAESGFVLRGRDEILAHRLGKPRRPGRYHLLTNLRILSDEPGPIRSEQLATVVITDDRGPRIELVAKFRDTVERDVDGRLRFAERIVERDLPGALS